MADGTDEKLSFGDVGSNEPLKQRIAKLYKFVSESLFGGELPAGMTDEVQIELGKWVNILSDLTSMVSPVVGASEFFPRWRGVEQYLRKGAVDPEDMYDRTELAIKLLLTKPGPTLNLVRELRYEIRKDLLWNGGPFQRLMIRMTGGSASMTVVWGALCTTLIGLPILIYLLRPGTPEGDATFLLIHQKVILGTAVPAFLGAVVSIIARLQDFETARSSDPKLLFMTAFFKPYIGMITGLFIISALAVGIGGANDIKLIPDTTAISDWPNLKVYYFLYVVGFLAGFSERLTKDFVGMAEDRFTNRLAINKGAGSRTIGT